MRVRVEQGPKGKKSVAYVADWPGLARGAKTDELAVEKLAAYRARYQPVSELAGMCNEFRNDQDIEIVERYPGLGSTDFWGISWTSSPEEIEMPYTAEDMERHVQLLQGCWAYFDSVAARVSSELAKGPRGTGRNRDEIINHVFGSERTQMSPRVGVNTPPGVMLTPDGLKKHRQEFVDGIREYHREGKKVGRTKTLPYLVRHACYHVLDHAWEMEDKDLSGEDNEQ